MQAPGLFGNTPLHLAVTAGRVPIVDLLLHAEADVTAKVHTQNAFTLVYTYTRERERKRASKRDGNKDRKIYACTQIMTIYINV
jgi:ankyrin repeat protein